MPKYNATPLLYKELCDDRFLQNLDVPEKFEKEMKAAKVLVRNKIKSAFTLARNDLAVLSVLNEDQKLALAGIEPRFWSQGSAVYKTQNMPAQNPPQQIDLDDGTYLPIEILRDDPIINKEIFFGIVDKALKELADDEGWIFEEKDTCARLIISREIHIDVPLYAVHKERFRTLEKAMGRAVCRDQACTMSTESQTLLTSDDVYLARRDKEHWVRSDPKQLEDWFMEEADTHEPLRRVCRYIKAWRDYQWSKGGPSSIALLICVSRVFNNNSGFENDSNALAAVFDELPSLLSEGVRNPRDNTEIIFPRGIEPDEIANIISKASESATNIINVLNRGNSQQVVVDIFQQAFGQRIPNRVDYVEHVGTSVSAAEIVYSTPAIKTLKPEVTDNLVSG